MLIMKHIKLLPILIYFDNVKIDLQQFYATTNTLIKVETLLRGFQVKMAFKYNKYGIFMYLNAYFGDTLYTYAQIVSQ